MNGFSKYIFLLTNGNVKGKINAIYTLIFLIPYIFVKYFLRMKSVRPITLTLPFDCIVKTPHGKFYCRRRMGDFAVVEPYYEKEIQNIFLQHKDFNVFVDVGAHIGKYSITMASLNKKGKVIAIDPDTRNFKALNYNIKINGLKNVKALPFAVGFREGLIKLFYDKWLTTTPSAISNLQTKTYILVKCKKLDNLLTTIKQIDLIKIDVEGMELEVFKGAKNILRRTKAIIFESFEDNIKNIKVFLEKNNFKVSDTKEKDYYYAINMKWK
jgi:FkbM family methyltransferase